MSSKKSVFNPCDYITPKKEKPFKALFSRSDVDLDKSFNVSFSKSDRKVHYGETAKYQQPKPKLAYSTSKVAVNTKARDSDHESSFYFDAHDDDSFGLKNNSNKKKDKVVEEDSFEYNPLNDSFFSADVFASQDAHRKSGRYEANQVTIPKDPNSWTPCKRARSTKKTLRKKATAKD